MARDTSQLQDRWGIMASNSNQGGDQVVASWRDAAKDVTQLAHAVEVAQKVHRGG